MASLDGCLMFNRKFQGNFNEIYNGMFNGMIDWMGNFTKTSAESFKGSLMQSLT